ncbi:MAG: hypothetical protein PVG14_13285 [Anaerolineales bacterium]|jgi:WD40 repeat protein
MSKIKRLLIALTFPLAVISCSPSTEQPNKQPVTATQKASSTPIGITPTATQPTETAIIEPTKTLIPTLTALPTTSTPEPFLPEKLPLINPENISDLQQVAELPVKEIYALIFSQSGDKLASLSERWQDRSKFMEVWDLVTGVQILFLDNLDDPWRAVFSADESQLFVFYPNQRIEIYDLAQKKLVRTMESDADRVDFTPDGKYMATGLYLSTTEESTISVVELASEQEQLVKKTPGLIMEIKFSPNGNLLVGGLQRGNHYRTNVWDVRSGELITEFIDYPYGLTFSPDSSVVATSKGERINIFATSNWEMLSSFGFTGAYRDVAPKSFSPDGKILAGEDQYNIVFTKPDTGEELYILPDECDVRFSPKGTALITWCYQSELKIWAVTR